MSKDYTIFASLFHFKCSDEELVAAYVLKKKAELIKQGGFHRAGFYTRYMISDPSDTRQCDIPTLKLPRARGISHAFAAGILMPHSSYTLRFVLMTIWCYLHRSCSVLMLCEKYHIGTSTLYEWLDRFKLHKASWKRIINDMRALSDEIAAGRFHPASFDRAFRNCFDMTLQKHHDCRYSTLPFPSAPPKHPP